MISNTSDFAVAPVGAALPGVRSPWTSLPVAVANPVRPKLTVAVVMPESPIGAFGPATAAAQTHQLAVVAAGLTTEFGTQKQNNHKTRIGVGGYGAMGPHPEREPA